MVTKRTNTILIADIWPWMLLLGPPFESLSWRFESEQKVCDGHINIVGTSPGYTDCTGYTALLLTQGLFRLKERKKTIIREQLTLTRTLSLTTSHKLRFILPCKSDCQPIFPKMQRTHLIFSKLWFVRPQIFQIRDSSPQFISNVTFGKSLAFQWREECVLDFFLNWTSRGVNCGVTKFHTQLCMFIDILELRLENQKISLAETVLIVWSQICVKIT